MYIVVVVLMLVSGCGWAAPDAGYEAVLIMKPWFFGHGGVYSDSIKTGRSLISMTTDVEYVEMRPTQYPIHLEDFMSKDGVPLDFDSVIRIQVLDSVKLIQGFGDNWYKVNVEMEFANRMRQAVRKHGMNETAIDTTAIEDIDNEITQAMEEYFNVSKLPVKLIQVTVGRANPPDSIKDQRIQTATQQQRQLTERERKLAEDQRKEAEQSRANADNAYRNAMSLSPSQFIQLETIKMQQEVCSSKTACTFVINGSVVPVVDVKH